MVKVLESTPRLRTRPPGKRSSGEMPMTLTATRQNVTEMRMRPAIFWGGVRPDPTQGLQLVAGDPPAFLELKPGDKIEIDLLPGGRAQLSAARPRASVSRLSGLLAGKTNDATLTINEIEDAIARAGAAAGLGEQ